MRERSAAEAPKPPRLERPSIGASLGLILGLAVVGWSFAGTGWSFSDLGSGLPALADFFARAWPPRFDRLDVIGGALAETFQMAIVGTLVGALLSLPLALYAAKGVVGGRLIYALTRGLIAFFRTIPDLVWALIFVIAVGLGPFAGTLAIVVDTIGFCARFFAEALEDAEKGPVDALRAQGSRRVDAVFCALLPATIPAFLTITLYALEKAIRSSVILGLVGAGGIGLELKVAMDMFDYRQAATIILLIFSLVLLVERAGTLARHRFLHAKEDKIA